MRENGRHSFKLERRTCLLGSYLSSSRRVHFVLDKTMMNRLVMSWLCCARWILIQPWFWWYFRSLTMNQSSLLAEFGEPITHCWKRTASSTRRSWRTFTWRWIVENERRHHLLSRTLTNAQMALMIRRYSGIVCLCLTDEQANQATTLWLLITTAQTKLRLP